VVACITGKYPLSFAMPESSRTADCPACAASLRVEAVRLRRGITTVFDGLDLQLDEPRVGLIGDNGAGKTSLFRLLCGLDA
ncbi:ATP-binding cassette domain-containing protein, partial [Escherichia coli]|uniref:ATP-binding cassette domain-containing protein n=1 Tax=Escherichia coli TaxID=562 RepID=UPI0039E03719